MVVYDISQYNANLRRDIYNTEIILDLNKKIEGLKQIVFEKIKIPKERQKFYLNNEELNNDWRFTNPLDINLFKDNISIDISTELNDIIYVKYPNLDIKEITTDLYNTGFEFLKEIENYTSDNNADFDIKYIFVNKLFLFYSILIYATYAT